MFYNKVLFILMKTYQQLVVYFGDRDFDFKAVILRQHTLIACLKVFEPKQPSEGLMALRLIMVLFLFTIPMCQKVLISDLSARFVAFFAHPSTRLL